MIMIRMSSMKKRKILMMIMMIMKMTGGCKGDQDRGKGIMKTMMMKIMMPRVVIMSMKGVIMGNKARIGVNRNDGHARVLVE
jgi:hypothetical protein